MCQQTIVGVALKRCGPLESLVHGNRARQSSGEDGWKRARYRVTRWPSILLKTRNFVPLVNISLEELVPADHFYRQLEQKLDLSFVRELTGKSYARGGR